MDTVIKELIIGTLECANGDKYNGEWKDDQKNGNGTLHLKRIGTFIDHNGNKYEGDWIDNSKSGKGIMIYNLRQIYTE